jgi:ATP-dependent DNA helicase RecQ
MVHVIESLRRHFGHTSFRPGQETLVRAVLDGRDVLAVMPTGSGKSLGFELPAVRSRARRSSCRRSSR